MFEALENVDPRDPPGRPVETRVIGLFEREDDAIAAGRAAMEAFVESGRPDYAWWLVREEGSTLARWIVDSSTRKEYVLDLRSGELVEIP